MRFTSWTVAIGREWNDGAREAVVILKDPHGRTAKATFADVREAIAFAAVMRRKFYDEERRLRAGEKPGPAPDWDRERRLICRPRALPAPRASHDRAPLIRPGIARVYAALHDGERVWTVRFRRRQATETEVRRFPFGPTGQRDARQFAREMNQQFNADQVAELRARAVQHHETEAQEG